MNVLSAIYANFLRLAFRKKLNYLFYFVLPAACFVLLSALFSATNGRTPAIGWSNLDEGPLGAELVRWLGEGGKNSLVASTPAEAERRLLEGGITLFLEIPPDYSARVMDPVGPEPELKVVSPRGETATATLSSGIERFTASLAELYRAAGTDTTLAERLRGEFLADDRALSVETLRDGTMRRTAGSISFGFLLFLMLMQAQVVTGLMLKEKENRTYLRVRLAPVREIHYALGNLLAAFTILASQTLLTLAVLRGVLGFDLTVPAPAALALLLGFGLAAIGLGVMVTALASSTAQAAFLGNLVIMVSTMLSGCFWPIDFLPEPLRALARLFPQAWVMEAVSRLQGGEPFGAVAFTVPLLAAFAALFAAVYAYAMRRDRAVREFG